jgi:hypothetical protein
MRDFRIRIGRTIFGDAEIGCGKRAWNFRKIRGSCEGITYAVSGGQALGSASAAARALSLMDLAVTPIRQSLGKALGYVTSWTLYARLASPEVQDYPL